MKRRRRIEIIAFRRITIIANEAGAGNSGDSTLRTEKQLLTMAANLAESKENDGHDSSTATVNDLSSGQLVVVDAVPASEVALLVKALIESQGNTRIASRGLGLSRSGFRSKLSDFGCSLKQLKTRLIGPRHRQSNRENRQE